MGFSQSVRWWDDWQLRFLLLASLFFQCFLFFAAPLRKRRVPHWFRSLIWLAYQAGDLVVICTLAALFNRHMNDDYSGIAHLDTLWAPILLLHLGGQDRITAYSIEDNENWRRHFFIAVSQITVAVYSFRKTWWLQDRKLLRTAIFLFVPGILKCLHKPWALKNATATSIMNSSDPQLETTLDLDDEVAKIDSLNTYVQKAAEIATNKKPQPDIGIINKYDLSDEPYHLFVDLGHPYAIRLKNLQLVAPPAGGGGGGEDLSFHREVHDLVRSSLSRAFNRLYTKQKASVGGLLRAAVVLAAFLDVAGVQRRHRVRSYARADVAFTYAVLLATAALELVAACSSLPRLDDRIAQYNLIGYLARNRKHQGSRKLARMAGLGFKGYLDTVWCTAPPEPPLRITKLVHNHVAGGWRKRIESVADYRRFNDSRGQWTLERNGCGGGGSRTAMAESLRLPFDESVLVWHLATELCYFDHVDGDCDATRHARVVSNYMAYLLATKPEMLIPGARPGLFRAVYEVLKKMLDDEPEEDEVVELWRTEKKPMASPPRAKHEMARRIIQKVITTSTGKKTTSTVDLEDLVRKAWDLACELMKFAKTNKVEEGEETELPEEDKNKAEEEKPKLPEEEKRRLERKEEAELRRQRDERMWKVIQGVWVEMLCFSAGRCRGHLHAKSLGTGGEYLSYVWLLLSYMGMETTPERMQRSPEDLVLGDTGALVKAPTEEDEVMETSQQPAALGPPNNQNSDTTTSPPPATETTAPAAALGPENNC